MTIEFERDVTGASDEAIAAFEKARRISLPEAYKLFLRKYNGGCPVRPEFRYFDGREQCDDSVRQFLGLGSNGEDSLEEWLASLATRLPAHMLPIAYDDMGNVICMSLGQDGDTILLWDHESEGNAKSMPDMFPIANSFAEFCAMLGVKL